MEDLVKKLRMLAIQEEKNREKVTKCLRLIEKEIAYALYFLYGKSASRSHSKLMVNSEEGLVFIYDFSEEPDKEGFVFETGTDFNKEYERLEDVKGKRFWSALEVILEWIPEVISNVVEQEKAKLKMITQLEKLTATVNEEKV